MRDAEILIPLTALTIPIVVVPCVLLFKHMEKSRTMTHQERLRALEMGQAPGGSLLWPSLAAIAIGGVAPAAAFLFAWLANAMSGFDHEIAWGAAGLVGGCGTVSAAGMMKRVLEVSRAPAPPPYNPADKPLLDPDAYDTVGRRG
jgi:hypothetical protein